MFRYTILIALSLLVQSCSTAPQKNISIALIGDSTVAKQSGWGDAFSLMFNEKVTVNNFAVGGRSSKSWLAEKRLPKALESKLDYVFIQFGHNGQPGKGPARETVPQTTYKDYLRVYIKEFKAIGTQPVLLSSVTRRKFKGGKVISSLTPWAQAAKELALEEGIPFIDLHSISIDYHNEIGLEASMKFNPKTSDITHFNEIGGEIIARLIIQDFESSLPELKAYLK